MEGVAVADFAGSKMQPTAKERYLDFEAGERLTLESIEHGWAQGADSSGAFGWFPAGFWKATNGNAWSDVQLRSRTCAQADAGEFENGMDLSDISTTCSCEKDGILESENTSCRDPELDHEQDTQDVAIISHSLSRSARTKKKSASLKLHQSLRILYLERELAEAQAEANVLRNQLRCCTADLTSALAVPQLSRAGPCSNACLWQFKGDDDSWCAMPVDTNQFVHDAYVRYRRDGPSTCTFLSGTHAHTYDFLKLEQTNIASKVVRKIRWKFGIPSHWHLNDVDLMERQLDLQTCGSVPMGGFVRGETVFTECGRRGQVIESDRPSSVRVEFDDKESESSGPKDFSAGSLSLVGPLVAGGFRVGQTVHVKSRYMPFTPYGSTGIVDKASMRNTMRNTSDACYVQVDFGGRLTRCHTDELSAYKLGSAPKARSANVFEEGQIVFALKELVIPKSLSSGAPEISIPAGAMYEVQKISQVGRLVAPRFGNQRSAYTLAVLECQDLLPAGDAPLTVTVTDLSAISPAAPVLQGGFSRGQEVVWWNDDDLEAVWRGIVKGLPADGSAEHLAVSFCGGSHECDCRVDRLTPSIHVKPRRVLEKVQNETDLKRLEDLMRASIFHHSNVRRGSSSCNDVKKGFKVKAVWHVENWPLWRSYLERRQQIEEDLRAHAIVPQPVDPPLVDPLRNLVSQIGSTCNAVNETILFHGTHPQIARRIAAEGFDDRVSKAGYYGMGTYFTPQMCKSHQYTRLEDGVYTVIISRVAVGEPHFATSVDHEMRRPPFGASPTRPCDSVIARPGKMQGHFAGFQCHQEIVIFERAQAYPEYIVEYTL